MIKYGLLGKALGHSYSPFIHRQYGDYAYDLYEKNEEELEDFLKNGDWDGLNVTIPYKKAVLPFLDELSEAAKEIGSVNTLVKRADGSIFGDNTDAYGFAETLRRSGIALSGKKALVLGNGGACPAVCHALKQYGAVPVIISRRGEDNYTNLDRHADAEIIVNTTPLGMYPNNGEQALDLACFKMLSAVYDLIYNPARTALLLQAEELGIPAFNGLFMLAAQAAKSSELFTGKAVEEDRILEVAKLLTASNVNVVLIGMPGCGKTTIAEKLSEKMHREVLDIDILIAEQTGMTPASWITEKGEGAFRDIESEAVSEAGKLSGKIIATGGGAVLRPANYPALHQNGIIIWLQRDTSALPVEDRPLSQGRNLKELLAERTPYYERYADFTVDNDGTVNQAVQEVLAGLKNMIEEEYQA